MLKLHGTLPVLKSVTRGSYLVTLTKDASLAASLRSAKALLLGANQNPTGYKAVLARQNGIDVGECQSDVFQISDEYNYLDEGDILRLDAASGAMRCLYRRSAPSNSILLTEQCNHYCLMCSQPPKTRDDSWLLREAFELISIIPAETKELILTGGEPTLYDARLVELLNHAKQCLPNTAIHLLSNGRAFKDFTFARLYAAVQHPDLMIGIPIYADDPTTHDYVVQSRGAFDDTIRGILN